MTGKAASKQLKRKSALADIVSIQRFAKHSGFQRFAPSDPKQENAERPAMNSVKTIDIKVPSGIMLSCAQQGDPHAPAVLLLHGYSDSWRSYGPLMAALSPSYRAIAVSLRGHGDSHRPETGYSIDDMAGDLPAVMDRFGIASAAVVGHSMGSMVAARLAIDHPERVRALVLIGALTTLKGNAAVETELREAVAAMTDPVARDFVRAFQESTLARPVPAEFLASVVAESLKLPVRVWRQALDAMLDTDLGPELQRIAAPTLILWGDEDGICERKSQTNMAKTIPAAQLSVLAGAGHAPHWEDPRGIATVIMSFIGMAARDVA